MPQETSGSDFQRTDGEWAMFVKVNGTWRFEGLTKYRTTLSIFQKNVEDDIANLSSGTEAFWYVELPK